MSHCYYCNKSRTPNVDFPFIKLYSHRPETGKGLYQDPNTLERHKAPTGDLHAMPEKKPEVNEDLKVL